MFRYSLYGLELASELELALPPGLRAAQPAEASIARGAPLARLPATSGVASADGIVTMTIAGVACYRIGQGRSIEVCAHPRSDPDELALFLLGSAFGVLLQQRGVLALHANALSDPARDGCDAIAVAGRSGSGKSTLAARLCAHGMKLLSDDVCAIGFAHGGAIAQPGVARFRLWGEALDRLGWDRPARQVSHRIDKWEVGAARHLAGPTPLRAIYALETVADEAGVGGEAISGADAVAALMANSYRGDLLELSGNRAWHFEQCLRLARTVPIFRWRRRWGHEHGEADTAALLAHARGLRTVA